MRQRTALAQALLGDPDQLVLDEPTAGLDPERRLRLRGLVSSLARDRVVLLSPHLTEDVEAVCDQVVVLDGGTVRFDGATADLAAVARGQVWRSASSHEPGALSWRTADGSHGHIGQPPAGAELVAPSAV